MPSPLIPVDLDIRRHLSLDNRALFTAEVELSGFWCKPVNIVTVLLDREAWDVPSLALLLWAGLRHEDAHLTVEQIRDALDPTQVASIFTAIYAAVGLITERNTSPSSKLDELIRAVDKADHRLIGLEKQPPEGMDPEREPYGTCH